jgi:hypothetical protein
VGDRTAPQRILVSAFAAGGAGAWALLERPLP